MKGLAMSARDAAGQREYIYTRKNVLEGGIVLRDSKPIPGLQIVLEAGSRRMFLKLIESQVSCPMLGQKNSLEAEMI